LTALSSRQTRDRVDTSAPGAHFMQPRFLLISWGQFLILPPGKKCYP
jgi:hypothetical protein